MNNNDPEISVIIPTYNAADYIAECIESVLDQGCPALEVLVIDDCSTDNTRDIVSQFDASLVRYHCLPKNFGGPSRPRNEGVRHSRGDYLVMLDSDDLLTRGSVQKRVDTLKNDPSLGFVFCDGVRFSAEEGEYANTFLSQHDYFQEMLPVRRPGEVHKVESLAAFRSLAKGDYILPSGLAMPKSVFSVVGQYDESVTNGQDLDMSLRIAERFPIAYVDMIGFKQRMHPASISRRGGLLTNNRIHLLQKNIERCGDEPARRSLKKRISDHYYSAGYQLQQRGDMAGARKHFLTSLSYCKNMYAFKGLLITFLGNRVYRFFKNQ